MKKWKRAAYSFKCGAVAHCRIGKGELFLELSRDGWKIRRCAQHAGEAVPAEIEGEEVYVAQPMTGLRELAKRFERFDPKMKQANDSD